MSYTLIERRELTENASSVTLSSIPQFYSDLYVVVSGRTSRTEVIDGLDFRPNGLTTNFSWRRLFGTGSSVDASSGTNPELALINSANNTSNTFSNIGVYIPNYTSSTGKSFSADSVSENNATSAYQAFYSGFWSQTAPITSLVIASSTSNNLVAGSSISLYGINRQQAIGAPKAIGGAISFANGYWIHTFTGSGTFYAQEDIECQYLVIAGGGGSSGGEGGGAGAGGYRSSVFGELSGGGASAERPLAIPARTSHIIAVGAGGAATPGSAGNSSIFSSITSLGGAPSGTGQSNGISGASGSGAGIQLISSPNLTGGAGVTGQGFAGGNVTGNSGAGGGGGAGAVGVSANSNLNGQNGGAGVTSSITGSAVIRGGGGGGTGRGGQVAGLGGSGGGGNGGIGSGATAGAANTGGGAGAMTPSGVTGGSGIVIIRYKA